MTFIWTETAADTVDFTDNGGGNGVWDFNFVGITDYTDLTLYARSHSYFYLTLRSYDGDPISGVAKIEGTTVVPDMGVWNQYDNTTITTTLSGDFTATVEVTGCAFSPADTWDNVTLSIRQYRTVIYPIVWLNPLTMTSAESYEGGHLYDSSSRLTSPGYDYTVVHNYQIWGPGDLYFPLRIIARDDGQGTVEGHPRMRGSVDTTSSTLGHRIFMLDGGTYR